MKVISIDEIMNMPINELNKLIDDNSYIDEDGQVISGIKVDMKGQEIEDLVEKYNLITIDEARNNIFNKFNQIRRE